MASEYSSVTEWWLRSDGDVAVDSGAGCREAYAELHRRFYGRLVRLCHARLDDAATAEDIAQSTLMCAIDALATFDSRRPLWPWLRVIALRQCATESRTRRREVVADLTDAMVPEQADPNEQFVDEHALQEALAGLPSRQRLALSLRYLEDLERDEAARVIGINRNAFDQLLARGRSSLAAAFASDHAVRGFGLVAIIAVLRRLGRRATDAGSSSASALAPVLGASLAAFAGAVVLLQVQVDQGAGTLRQARPVQMPVTRSVSTVLPTADVRSARQGAHAASVPAVRRAPSHQAAPATVAVSSHPLRGGRAAQSGFSIDTPAGTLNGGGGIRQSPGGATVCDLLDSLSSNPRC